MKRILVCDDEPSICLVLEGALRRVGFDVESVHTLADAAKALRDRRVDILFLDIFLPDGNGLDKLRDFREAHPNLLVIVLTAHGTMTTALEAMKRDAFDYLTKPFDVEMVRQIAQRAARTLDVDAESGVAAPPDPGAGEAMIGNSRGMQEVYKMIGRVAASDVTVLLQGECGTGKELVAQAIHANSHRGSGPWVVVNCAAIPDALLESELFGHVRGAFTNAVADRKGRFEGADGGTLFLDEIGDIALELQTKLLRVIQDHSFQPVGSNVTKTADVRIITATNRDLVRAVRDGDFREDLLYRLNVVPITLPPLRNRVEDIPLLVDYFVDKYCRMYGREPVTIADRLGQRLRSYHWPGNVRELENAIHRAIVMVRGNVLTEDDVPLLAPQPETESGESVDLWLRRLVQKHLEEGRMGQLHEEALAGVEVPLFRHVLESTEWNKSRAADILGINRNTLHAKMKRYGIDDAGKMAETDG